MSNVSFRRGGLFDPMMIDAGQTLANSAGLFANSLGKPTFDVESPDAWKAQAARLQSLGDSQGAIQALSMGQRLEAQRQAKMDALQPVQSDARANARNIMEGAKAKAKDAADIEKLAKMAESRFGADTAELVRMLPKDQAIQLIRNSSQGPKKSPKLIKEVGEDGNTYNVIVDQNNPEDKTVLGVASLGKSEADAQEGENLQIEMRDNIRELLMNPDALDAYSGVSGRLPTVRGSQVSWEAKLAQVISEETLKNTDKLKGQMSDNDILLLKQAATSIVEGGDYKENRKELIKMYKALGGDPAEIEAALSSKRSGQGGRSKPGFKVIGVE